MSDFANTQLSEPRVKRINILWWPEVLAFLGFHDTAVRLRWKARNASEPAVCKCGKPASNSQHVNAYKGYGPVFYSCDDHRNVPLTTPWSGNGDGTYTPMVQNEEGVWTTP